MLTIYSFCINSIIIIYFNFKIKQFNIINAFIIVIKNSKRLLIIYKLLLSFKKLKYIIKVNCFFYKL